jgi:uncharacterized protein YecT (DUF1311 family)
MRLLVVENTLVVALICCVFSGLVLAGSRCSSSDLTNQDIINCSQVTYVKIDKLMDEQYKKLILEIDVPLSSNLLAIQQSWIRLRDDYCEEDDGETSGAESPIEKLSCKAQFTSFRLNEILYLRSGVIGDGFYKAVSIVNKKATVMDFTKAVKYVAGDVDFGPAWKTYAVQNCTLTHKMFGEIEERCMARMQFQMPIY